MNRAMKTIKNIILIGVLFALFLAFTGLRLSPIQAHIASENSIHYGPSEIVNIFDHGDYQHLLCKYDRWISCNTVNKHLFFLWAAGSQPIGFENDLNKDIDYSRRFSKGVNLVYGSVNNTNITKVELHISEENILVQDAFYDDLFYFTWKSDGSQLDIKKIIGYDSNDEIVYQISQP